MDVHELDITVIALRPLVIIAFQHLIVIQWRVLASSLECKLQQKPKQQFNCQTQICNSENIFF